MTGFVRGLFGSKAQAMSVNSAAPEAEAPQAEAPKAKPAKVAAPKVDNTYFLSADEAKTFGNIELMQTMKIVKRTFPGQKLKENEAQIVSAPVELKPMVIQPEATSAPVVDAAAERRRTDTNMDMFRSMARDMRKKS